MKTLLAICLFVTATLVWADENAAAQNAAVLKGEVLEVINAANYTYLRLKTGNGETWAAVAQSQVKQGTTVTIEDAMVMSNFESKALKKTFPTIIFGKLAGSGISAATSMPSNSSMGASGNHVMGMASPLVPQTPAIPADIHVKKASGENARTVAEIMSKSAELKNKQVIVRGMVVKYNPGIMGKNWVHLRDGTGSVESQTNDVLVTTLSSTKLGDTVTAKGIVHTDKDFGAGYVYKVLVEDATLQ